MSDPARGCADMSPNDFHPERGGPVNHLKAICRACPFVDDCRDYALAHPELHGIWGATSVRERQQIRNRRRRRTLPPHGTTARYRAHYRRGETPCEACKAAHAAYLRADRAG